MPVLDKPLKELQIYQGSNPRPEDFDAYWEKALDELDHTPANAAFLPAEFQVPDAECYDLYFDGTRGARIHAKHLRPKNIQGKIPTVLLFHGYSGDAGSWNDKLNYVQAGFAVYAIDVRGQGGLSQDTNTVVNNTLDGHIIRGLDDEDPQKLFFRDVYLDCVQMARIAFDQPFCDPEHVCATGGSQGGALTIACASLEPRISRIAPRVPFLCDYKRVWDMDLDIDAYTGIRQYFRLFDPLHLREEAIFTKLGYIDLQFLAPRIKAETAMFTGLLDNICPPSTQFAAFNKMTCKKHHFIYPDYKHEDPKGSTDIIFRFFVDGYLPEI